MSRVIDGKEAAKLARALGDPLRLAILSRLAEGPAAVTELVAMTGESQPNVSNHLAVLRDRKLVAAKRRERHLVYELRDPSVAQLLESLLSVAGVSPPEARRPDSISIARTCYDHLAGKLGVAIFDALFGRKALITGDQMRGEVEIGPAGPQLFSRLGLDVLAPRQSRRRFAYACLDWTERRPHLGGWLGAQLCDRAIEGKWVVKGPGSRAVSITPSGIRALRRHLGVAVSNAG